MPAKITQTYLKNVAIPTTGSVTVYDSEMTGFGVRVHAKGTRQLFLDYRLDGATKRIAIGKWGDWTADEARARAKELRQLVDAGRDPAGEKRERRTAATIRDLRERYERDHLAAKTRRRPKEDARILDEIERILGKDTKVASVHFGDMEDLHKKITHGYTHESSEYKARPVRANRVIATASVMFSMSLKPLAGEDKPWRNAVDGNPCRGVVRNHEEPSGRLYSATELAAIADALEAYPGRVAADCVRLIMASGCRPIEAKKARWEEFDKEPGLWIRPSSHTKQRREHPAPLSKSALALVARLREAREPGQKVVFPGRSPDGTIDALHHVWNHVRKRAGLDKSARCYDLRHSVATLAAKSGASLVIIGKLLGHATERTTAKYARHLEADILKTFIDRVDDQITGKRLRLVSGGKP
jgi:integrase